MTINPHDETEDFDKTISFESGQFAIVDAEIVKSLKDKVSLDDKAVFVATKQSRDNVSPFKITAEYDDATLRRLVIEPADLGDAVNQQSQVEEGIQINGHEGNSVEKKIAKITRKAGSRPKSADRSERNKRYSAKGDQKTKLTKGNPPAVDRIKQKISIDGAKRDNYGQPRSKIEVECMDLITHAKKGLLNEDYFNSMSNLREIRHVLADVRDNDLVSGKSFDLIYDVVQQLDEHWRKSACMWVENIIRDGLLDV